MMTQKERYRFFPIDSLDAEFSCPRPKKFDLLLDQEHLDQNQISLTGGEHKLKMKYPKGTHCDISLNLLVPENQHSFLQIEHLPSSGTCNFFLKVKMEKGSSLDIVEMTRTSSALKSSLNFDLLSDCSLDATFLDLDNRILSRDQKIDINGSSSFVDVKGLVLCSDKEMIDNYIKMNHNVPRSQSNQNVRTVSSGTASFLGHIFIAPDAQQSTAMQQAKSVVSGDKGEVFARPWLEIYADDVKCNHGATVGVSDEEALFYLRQRGIPYTLAKGLMLEGFVNEMLDKNMVAAKKYVKNKLLSI